MNFERVIVLPIGVEFGRPEFIEAWKHLDKNYDAFNYDTLRFLRFSGICVQSVVGGRIQSTHKRVLEDYKIIPALIDMYIKGFVPTRKKVKELNEKGQSPRTEICVPTKENKMQKIHHHRQHTPDADIAGIHTEVSNGEEFFDDLKIKFMEVKKILVRITPQTFMDLYRSDE